MLAVCTLTVVVMCIMKILYSTNTVILYKPLEQSVINSYSLAAQLRLESKHVTDNMVFPYVLSLKYENQLGSAASRLVQLLNISIGWNRRMVEPFQRAARYYGVPTSAELKSTLRFSDLFNLSAVNMQMGKCFKRVAYFSRFEDFISSSTRKFIVLVFLIDRKKKAEVFDCTESLREDSRNIEQQLNMHVNRRMIAKHGPDYLFKAVKAICVNANGGFTFQDLEKAVNVSSSDGKLTIVLPNWKGLSSTPSINNAKYYVNDTSFHLVRNVPPCDPYTFPHASLVVRAAKEFKASLKFSSELIVIHIRIERLLQNNVKHQGYLDMCLDKSQSFIQALKNATSSDIVALHDYSKYGSGSCAVGNRSICIAAKDMIVSRLKRWGVRTLSYEPTLFDKPSDRGFVSLVEKEFMASADHLLVVGGGWYQKGVKVMFEERQGRNKAYSLCDNIHGTT